MKNTPDDTLASERGNESGHASYESDLKALHEISFELSLCQSVDDVCLGAVRLGFERLGFGELGIWLADQKDPRWMLGTWRLDAEGNPRDELGSRIPRKKGGESQAFAGGKLAAPLWDGHRYIGELRGAGRADCGSYCLEKREAFVILSRIVAHIISLKQAESELRLLASTDSLTGAVNRRTALIILEKHIGQCKRSGSPLALCLADLDGLKLVNDAFGHAAGDEYIRRASSALVGAVRASDTVGRIGGDEFLVIFPDCRGDVVAAIMEKVNAALAGSGRAGEGPGYLRRLSWGIASLGEISALSADSKGGEAEEEGTDLQRCIDLLLELADQRMYEDKRSQGRARKRASGETELAF
jgi:diguanylate cyclase (GGDEF)-like protein